MRASGQNYAGEGRLHLDRLPTKQRERIRLIHGSLMYADPRLAGFDARRW